ncbi:MAG: diaminobutyrate acetyltransferase [Microbacteriaceae bacterium]
MNTDVLPDVHSAPPTDDTAIRPPDLDDGADMWRIARDSRVLDLNSTYAYLLYCRNFARSCRVAVIDGEMAGFVMGHFPAEQPETLFIWQIAVAERFRGRGLAVQLLDDVAAAACAEDGVKFLETTITDDNVGSRRTFASFSERHGAPMERTSLFTGEHFVDESTNPEYLYRIGPLSRVTAR